MKHHCQKGAFLCSQLTESCTMYLEAQFWLTLSKEPLMEWTGETSTEVLACPFCGYKTETKKEE